MTKKIRNKPILLTFSVFERSVRNGDINKWMKCMHFFLTVRKPSVKASRQSFRKRQESTRSSSRATPSTPLSRENNHSSSNSDKGLHLSTMNHHVHFSFTQSRFSPPPPISLSLSLSILPLLPWSGALDLSLAPFTRVGFPGPLLCGLWLATSPCLSAWCFRWSAWAWCLDYILQTPITCPLSNLSRACGLTWWKWINKKLELRWNESCFFLWIVSIVNIV